MELRFRDLTNAPAETPDGSAEGAPGSSERSTSDRSSDERGGEPRQVSNWMSSPRFISICNMNCYRTASAHSTLRRPPSAAELQDCPKRRAVKKKRLGCGRFSRPNIHGSIRIDGEQNGLELKNNSPAPSKGSPMEAPTLLVDLHWTLRQEGPGRFVLS